MDDKRLEDYNLDEKVDFSIFILVIKNIHSPNS